MDDLDKKIMNVYEHLLRDYRNNIIHCGFNGPYEDPETNVRNLCNLIIATCIYDIEYKTSIDLKPIISHMEEDLFSYEDEDGLFIIRNKQGKDTCNGVLGHAWVIEALLYMYLSSKNQKYIEKALKIYFAHEFDKHLGLWKCPMKFGGKIDMTINHQIWFAGISAELFMLSKSTDIMNDLLVFDDLFWKNAQIHQNGLFCHYVQIWNGRAILKNKVKNAIDSARSFLGLSSMKYKENGYHMFCLCGLARLKMSGICEKIFVGKKIVQALKYCGSSDYLCSLEDCKHTRDISTLTRKEYLSSIGCNIYGYPYNAPGFEVKYVGEILGGINDTTIEYLRKQQSNFTYNIKTEMFDINTMDAADLNYKIYEALLRCEHWKERNE